MAAEQLEHRAHAIQIVAALPNDPEDALLVLRAAERLVKTYLIEPASKSNAPIRIVPHVRED
jgi:hypothetical protein